MVQNVRQLPHIDSFHTTANNNDSSNHKWKQMPDTLSFSRAIEHPFNDTFHNRRLSSDCDTSTVPLDTVDIHKIPERRALPSLNNYNYDTSHQKSHNESYVTQWKRVSVSMNFIRVQFIQILLALLDLGLTLLYHIYLSPSLWWMHWLSFFITIMFALEIVILLFYQKSSYWRSIWNIIDSITTTTALILFGFRPLWFKRILYIRFLSLFLRIAIQSHDLQCQARHDLAQKNIFLRGRKRTLDISYINQRFIVMSWPAQPAETIFHHRMHEVQTFLDRSHAQSYIIFNLCDKRKYSSSCFHGRTDHSISIPRMGCPLLVDMVSFCAKVKIWLDVADCNVVVIHSLYGHGRSAIMTAAWLLFANAEFTAMRALREFSDGRLMRVPNNSSISPLSTDYIRRACLDDDNAGALIGIETPSQARYVQYFSRLMRQRNRIEPMLEEPLSVSLHHIELLSAEGGTQSTTNAHWTIVINVFSPEGVSEKPLYLSATRVEDNDVIFDLEHVLVAGDFRLTVMTESFASVSNRSNKSDEALSSVIATPLCSLMLHSSMMDVGGKAYFRKADLDGLAFDVSHKQSSAAFALHIEYDIAPCALKPICNEMHTMSRVTSSATSLCNNSTTTTTTTTTTTPTPTTSSNSSSSSVANMVAG